LARKIKNENDKARRSPAFGEIREHPQPAQLVQNSKFAKSVLKSVKKQLGMTSDKGSDEASDEGSDEESDDGLDEGSDKKSLEGLPELPEDIEQFDRELLHIVDTCIEVSLAYTLVGRDPSSSSYSVQERHVENDSGAHEKKFRYKTRIFPFQFYQPMMGHCAYLVVFNRVQNAATVPESYPAPHEVFLMLGTLIEQVNDIPLGSAEDWQRFYDIVAKLIVKQIDSKYTEKVWALKQWVKKVHPTHTALLEPGNALSLFITTTGVHQNSDKAINDLFLPQIWPFIFKNGGHHGLMAYFCSCYKNLRGFDWLAKTGDERLVQPTMYNALIDCTKTFADIPNEGGVKDGAYLRSVRDDAQNMVNDENFGGDGISFKAFIDGIETMSLQTIRP
jgi:hypothetical protein